MSKTGVTPETKERKVAQNDEKNQEQEQNARKTYAEVTEESIARSLERKAKINDQSNASNISSFTTKSSVAFKGVTEGEERDQIIVDVLSFDGAPCKDHLTEREQNLQIRDCS